MFNLTEVDKTKLRMASDDRLMWLWHQHYKNDPDNRDNSPEVGLHKMKMLKASAIIKFDSDETVFGQTWLF